MFKMVKLSVVLFIVVVCVGFTVGLSPAGCPLSSKVTTCTPKCKDDTECFGQKCCPNICNAKSCVESNAYGNTKDGYKNQNAKTATGSYCGNVKCNSFEKCGLDPSTKRQKCLRN